MKEVDIDEKERKRKLVKNEKKEMKTDVNRKERKWI